MVTVVVVINTIISLILFYVAWRVWQLKQRIAYIGDCLTHYQRCSYALLNQAPENIYTGQQYIYNLRLKNLVLQAQIQQVRQILSLFLFAQQNWRRYSQKQRVNYPSKN